jgi:hypothetical protein
MYQYHFVSNSPNSHRAQHDDCDNHELLCVVEEPSPEMILRDEQRNAVDVELAEEDDLTMGMHHALHRPSFPHSFLIFEGGL